MNLTHEIHNGMDVIDSRDVIARIEELESDRDAALEDGETWFEDDAEELRTLLAFAEEGSGASDWIYGETFVRESYFEDYARELADDLGLISSESTWPARCIDWEQAADELRVDYSSAEFDGVTYYYRA
jgi:hypothetical protein